jgi:hypothetical protein
VVAHNKARFLFLDSSGRREAAGWHLLRLVGAASRLAFRREAETARLSIQRFRSLSF